MKSLCSPCSINTFVTKEHGREKKERLKEEEVESTVLLKAEKSVLCDAKAADFI